MKARYLILPTLFAAILAIGIALVSSKKESAKAPEVPDREMPAYVRALLQAYPEQLSHYKDGKIYFRDGSSVICDDGVAKDHLERLDKADIEDMFHAPYRPGEFRVPEYLSDPGRYRCEDFFKKIYGATEKQVSSHLVGVDWFGQRIPFTKANHASDSLKAVERDIKSNYPELEKYFEQSSSFNWRPVRGAGRMSAHSYGMAIDICVKYSNYWRWSNPGKEEMDEIVYENQIPEEIIQVFERHGFISGARWYHYDTMHFEFRPELLWGMTDE